MKMKEIASLCKKSKRIYLYNVPDASNEVVTQWIGNGSAVYPLYGVSYLDKKTILQVFDIPEDKHSSYFFHENEELPKGINFMDADEFEVKTERYGFPLILSGEVIQPHTVADSIAFFDLKYLAPVNSGDYSPDIFERLTDKGTPYYALKIGMLIVGIVMGYDAITLNVTEHLEHLAEKTRRALEDKKRKEEKFELVVVSDEDDSSDPVEPEQKEAYPEGKIITIWELFGEQYKQEAGQAQENQPEQIEITDMAPTDDPDPEVPEDEED